MSINQDVIDCQDTNKPRGEPPRRGGRAIAKLERAETANLRDTALGGLPDLKQVSRAFRHVPRPLEGIATYFEFDRCQTNFRTEIGAGITTFITMAYILVVNPFVGLEGSFVPNNQ